MIYLSQIYGCGDFFGENFPESFTDYLSQTMTRNMIKNVTKQIFINGRFLTQPITGVQRYAIELVKGLDDCLANYLETVNLNINVTILAPQNQGIDVKNLDLKYIKIRQVGWTKGHIWEQLELPWYALGGVLLNLGNTAPLIHPNLVVTIHDAAVFGIPDAYVPLFRYWYQFLYPQLGKRAKRIITDSKFSKQQLNYYAQIPLDKMTVIPLGNEHIKFTSEFASQDQQANLNSISSILADQLPEKFFLAVSSPSRHKNFSIIFDVINHLESQNLNLDFQVLVVGKADASIFSQQSFNHGKRVKYLGAVDDKTLSYLYQNATGLIYPSLYEGFGLPPLEAMTCGCPVITTQGNSLPEVCGDAVLYCDPLSATDIAHQVKELLTKPELVASLRQKGLSQIQGFSWQACAQKTWQLLQSI